MMDAASADTGSDGGRSRPVEEVLREEKLRYLSVEGVAAVPRDAPLRDALRGLADPSSRGAVLVVDPRARGRVVGILTERDFLDKLAGVEADLDGAVEAWMTPDPTCVSSSETIDRAVRLMTQGGYRHLPVVDGDRLVGLVSSRDIVDWLAEFFPVEVYNLPPRLCENEAFDTREGG